MAGREESPPWEAVKEGDDMYSQQHMSYINACEFVVLGIPDDGIDIDPICLNNVRASETINLSDFISIKSLGVSYSSALNDAEN